MSRVQFYHACVVRRTCRARPATSQRRDANVEPTELAAGRQKNCQQAGGNDEVERCFLCERLSAQSLCEQKYENKRSRHRCDASQNSAEKSECDARWQKQPRPKLQLRREQ